MLDASLPLTHTESISKSIRQLPSNIYSESDQFLWCPLVQATIYWLNFRTAFQLTSLPWIHSCPVQSTLHTLASCDFKRIYEITSHLCWRPPDASPAVRTQTYSCAKACRSFFIWIRPHFSPWSSHTGHFRLLKPNSWSPSHSLCACDPS